MSELSPALLPELVNCLKKIGDPILIEKAFSLVNKMATFCGISVDSRKFAFKARQNSRKRDKLEMPLNFSVGRLLVFALYEQAGQICCELLISEADRAFYNSLFPIVDVQKGQGNSSAFWIYCDAEKFFSGINETFYEKWTRIWGNLLQGNDSPYAYTRTEGVHTMVKDATYRNKVLTTCFPNYKPTDIMNYFLLGSAWGTEDKTDDFLDNGIWINAKEDEAFSRLTLSVKQGDRVALKSSYATRSGDSILRIKALGTVTKNLGDGEQLQVRWDENFRQFDLSGYGSFRKTIEQVKDEHDIKVIFYHSENSRSDSGIAKVKRPLNQILYGPPGTGKTYNTTTESAHILTGEEYSDKYEDAKAIYWNSLGDQIEFITFHQNYSYEDFVAGLRPNTDNTDRLTFKEHKGIFYSICERARHNLLASQQKAHYTEADFETVWDEFLQPLRDNPTSEIALETSRDRVPFWITRINQYNLSFRKSSGGTGHTLSTKTIQQIFEGKRDYPLSGVGIYMHPVVDKLRTLAEKHRAESEPEPLRNYVLIVDEINRANISRVFGELITLLEEDKRLGNKHEMEISLPNGERFSVPKNLYLIGTMNTADKSIALLDIALRRRFQFTPMFPKEELVRDPSQQAFLRSLNQRILDEKGADFLVGHAYFMVDEGESPKRFDELMNNQIIPLLNEYFYNDGSDKVLNLLQSAAQISGYQFVKDAYLGVTCNAMANGTV